MLLNENFDRLNSTMPARPVTLLTPALLELIQSWAQPTTNAQVSMKYISPIFGQSVFREKAVVL